MLRYNAYGPWLRKQFKSRVYKVSVDGGFTCPNRDGKVAWGGCTYCNNESFRPEGSTASRSIQDQIRQGIAYVEKRFEAGKFLVYWQSFTNTYASLEELYSKYSAAFDCDPRIIGMAIGTRPDCLEDEKLEMLSLIAERRYVCVEIGVESIFDGTLQATNRGHDFACSVDAVERLHAHHLPVCAHIVLGFPEESRSMLLEYPEVLNRLGVDFVKLHHLHLVRGTRLAKDFARAPFPLFDYAGWKELVLSFLERLEPGIVVQRLFGWAPPKELIAPQWNKSKSEILLDLRAEMHKRDSWQGKALGYPQIIWETGRPRPRAATPLSPKTL